MHHTISRLTGVILMLALLVACGLAVLAHAHGTGGMGGSATPARPTPCPNPPLSGGYGVSYAYAPENLHDMKAMSDLVAEVSIVSFVRTETETTPTDVYSIFTARVLIPIAGKHAAGIAAGATIQIRQLGGRVGCITYTLEGDPTLRPGERDILFLITHADDPAYDIIDDTVGRFIVESNGQIAPNTYNAFTTVNVATGTSDTTFIQQIRQA